MFLSRTTDAHAESARRGSVTRWQSEWATETWAVDPIDMLTAEQFEATLVAKFGPAYLQPIAYKRIGDALVPDPSPAATIARLFRQHETLTRQEVKQLTGYSNGRVAKIVCAPEYEVAETIKVKQMYAQKWRMAR